MKEIHRRLIMVIVVLAILVVVGWVFCRLRKERYNSQGNGQPLSSAELSANLQKYPMATYFEAPPATIPVRKIDPNMKLPDSFDGWRKSGLLHSSRNQGDCGSCWAYSVSGVLDDRINIGVCGKFKEYLSPQYLIDCDMNEMGCNGSSSLGRVFLNLRHDGKFGGIYSETDYPYVGKSQTCITTICDQNNSVKPCIPSTAVKYDFTDDSIVTMSMTDSNGNLDLPNSIINMKQEVIQNGPISVAMTVFSDFFAYTNGVYVPTTSQVAGGHAVKIVGWGKTTDSSMGVPAGTDYWIVRNSWGTGWGQNGYFYIKMGTSCNIESNAFAGKPDLSHPDLQKLLPGCSPPNFVNPSGPQPSPQPQPNPQPSQPSSSTKHFSIAPNPIGVDLNVQGGTIIEGYCKSCMSSGRHHW